jgi:hypothetical protein
LLTCTTIALSGLMGFKAGQLSFVPGNRCFEHFANSFEKT